MNHLARIAVTSLTSGLFFVVACASSEDVLPDEEMQVAAADSGGASLPAPSDQDAAPAKPKDAGPKDATSDAPVNTGTAAACGGDPGPLQLVELLGGAGSCDSTCDPATKCCFDVLSYLLGGGGGLPAGFDAGTGGGGATGVCLTKY